MQPDLIQAHPRLTIAAIAAATCAFYGETPEELCGPRRYRPLAHRRQAAMALARRLTGRSYPAIGRFFGRDHTTVIHAERAVAEREAADPRIRAEMGQIAAAAQHIAQHNLALGTVFLLNCLEAAEAAGRFIAGLAQCPAIPAAPSAPIRETALSDAWQRQIAAARRNENLSHLQKGEI